MSDLGAGIELFGGPLDGTVVPFTPGIDHVHITFGPCLCSPRAIAVYELVVCDHAVRGEFTGIEPRSLAI